MVKNNEIEALRAEVARFEAKYKRLSHAFDAAYLHCEDINRECDERGDEKGAAAATRCIDAISVAWVGAELGMTSEEMVPNANGHRDVDATLKREAEQLADAAKEALDHWEEITADVPKDSDLSIPQIVISTLIGIGIGLLLQ